MADIDASWPRTLFAWTVFPVTFGGALWLTQALAQAGWSHGLTTTVPVLLAVAVVALSERIQPHAEAWSRSHEDVPTDLAHMVFSQVLPPPLVDVALTLTLGAVAIALAERTGALWPAEANVWLQLVLATVVGELGQYIWHRTCHERAWFWRFHATHHSAPRLWWLNAGRFHPLDTVFSYTAATAPLVLLGCPPEVLALLVTFTAVHGMFQHANIELRLGPLNWVFSMAELHRWHHSKDLSLANANYGANVIVWDIVFGTRRLPTDREHDPADVGFHGDAGFPQTFLGQLATPFRWAHVSSEVEAAQSSSSAPTS